VFIFDEDFVTKSLLITINGAKYRIINTYPNIKGSYLKPTENETDPSRCFAPWKVFNGIDLPGSPDLEGSKENETDSSRCFAPWKVFIRIRPRCARCGG
jgi:hypothetical protein